MSASVSDVKLACEALKASGVSGCATWILFLPFGRSARMQAMLRKRRSVLEAKNGVLDCLFRFQKALEPLGLRSAEQVQALMRDPEKRRMLIAVGFNHAGLEDELGRYGTELGLSLDQALSELIREQRVLRVQPPGALPGSEIHLVVHERGRGHYDLGMINRLLQRNRHREYGDVLRARERDESGHGISRDYRL